MTKRPDTPPSPNLIRKDGVTGHTLMGVLKMQKKGKTPDQVYIMLTWTYSTA
jgi:hypothetical protein